MSLINKLPKTNFTLPSGDVVNTRNILKTIIIDENTKNNESLVKIKNGTTEPKLENTSYRFYGDKESLYWLTTHLNDIDSFDKFPIPKANFEANLPNRYPGKVYYVKEAKNITGIEPGDLFVMYAEGTPTGDNWKVTGIVKEYDPIFRRIIIEKEYENPNIIASLAEFPDIYIIRYDSEGSTIIVTQAEYQTGRTELEYQKTLSIYDTNLSGTELSPFVELVGGVPGTEYSFGDSPSSDTIIYKLNSSITLDSDLTGFYFHTTEKEQNKINNTYNNIKYFTQATAFEATSFASKLLAEEPIRGQKIIIEE